MVTTVVGGVKSNKCYLVADLNTVQAVHSSHQSLCTYVTWLKKRRFHIMRKVMQSHGHSTVMHISAMYSWNIASNMSNEIVTHLYE
jgi:hypothetical protein